MKTMWAYGQSRGLGIKVSKTPFDGRKPSGGIEKLEVPIPEIAADEVLVRVKAAALNYNSLWSSLCHPLTPAQLIMSYARKGGDRAVHNQPYAIFGSDASGIITEIGEDVSDWKVGDEVTIHCNVVDEADPITKVDDMLSETQAIWGYETNFGAFAEYTKVKASQLLIRPKCLDWGEAASYCLTLSTAYRMLISQNGARLQAGETCLIWGAAGGLGVFAIQLAKQQGAKVVAVVSNEEKAQLCSSLGADVVIDRSKDNFHGFTLKNGEPNYPNWHKAKAMLAKRGITSVDVIFEHVGKETLPISLYLVNRGGRVVTCAATSGYLATIDIRFLWMQLKRIIGSHFANSDEARKASALISQKHIKPVIHSYNTFDSLPLRMDEMYAGSSFGKMVFTVDE